MTSQNQTVDRGETIDEPRSAAGPRIRGRSALLLPFALMCSAFALLSVAWVFGNPPEAAPDEPAALVKTLAVGHFEFSGRPYTAVLPPYNAPSGLAWVASISRSYSLPARQTPASLSACMAFAPDVSAACLTSGPPHTRSARLVRAATPQGAYPPFLYVPLGLAARWTTTVTRAIYAARLASAGLTVLLLLTAVWAMTAGRRRGWSMLGLALAVSPMVIFLGATVSTNGMEIAAAVCFWAALLRVRLADAPPFLWGAVAAGGVVMGLARQLDVVWLVCGGLTFLALLGRKAAWERVRAGGRWSGFSLAIVTTAGAVSLLWDVLGMPAPTKGGGSGVAPNLPDVESLAHQAIGVFGWLDTPIPTGIEQAWLVAASALLIAAVLAGTWRERAVMTGTLAGIVGATVAMQMVLITPFGYGMQTRYVMPYLVAAPILAGEILSTRTVDRRGQLIDRSLIFAGLVLVAIGQWSGFYTNARRNGVGLHSSASLLSQSTWKPPGGTLLWLVVAAIGCSCLALSGAVFRDESSIS